MRDRVMTLNFSATVFVNVHQHFCAADVRNSLQRSIEFHINRRPAADGISNLDVGTSARATNELDSSGISHLAAHFCVERRLLESGEMISGTAVSKRNFAIGFE